MDDLVTTVLELAAVVLLALGAALLVAAMVGGLLGAGVGVLTSGLVLGCSSVVLQWLGRPDPKADRGART
jgi:hypothetical protein